MLGERCAICCGHGWPKATHAFAVEILADAPPATDDQEEVDADLALRDWAVQVLESNSPVALTPELATALRQGEATLQTSGDLYSLASQSMFPELGDGPLPPGCLITVSSDVPIYSEATAIADPSGTLGPGQYQALEFALGTGIWDFGGYFRVAEGWVGALGLGVSPDCFPGS